MLNELKNITSILRTIHDATVIGALNWVQLNREFTTKLGDWDIIINTRGLRVNSSTLIIEAYHAPMHGSKNIKRVVLNGVTCYDYVFPELRGTWFNTLSQHEVVMLWDLHDGLSNPKCRMDIVYDIFNILYQQTKKGQKCY